MKKDTIVQFVCFITTLEPEEFSPKWEAYARRLMHNNSETNLQQQVAENKNRYRYISQHEWPDRDFNFSFMNNKKSEHFPEHTARVVQIGGYLPLQFKKRTVKDDDEVKLLAFISHNENDIEFYRELPLYRHLNIHQAFYESCTYGYVMEFFVAESDSGELLRQIKQRPGVETGLYRECLVTHE